MVPLTRLSGLGFVLNADLIERIDATPDTVITLTNGTKYVVSESVRAVTSEVRLHRAEIIALSLVVQVGNLVPEDDVHPGTERPGTAHRGLATVTQHNVHLVAAPVSEGDR